jgi:hypothetical protein
MKKLISLNKYLLSFVALTIAIAGCVKKDAYYKENTTETNRKQTVQLTGASDIITFARDVKPTKDTFVLIDVRRYPNSNADLNQPLTVKLTKNSGLIDAYNTANGTGYIELPANSYTLLGDINAITFQPGEAVKEIKISVDQTKLDLSEQYALGFSIADPGSNAVIVSSLKNGLYAIGVKNKYDGHYQVTGTMVDLTNATLTGMYPMDVFLVTAGPNSVYMYDNAIGGAAHSISSSGSLSYYGGYAPQFFFDANDNVTSVENAYGQGNNNRSGMLDPSGSNKFKSSDHSLDVKYYMLQINSTTLPPPKIRTTFDEHFKYLGPR